MNKLNTILVTGGAGFIGSHLIDKLLDMGKEVICIDNFDPFYDIKLKKTNIRTHLTNPNYTMYEEDIRNISQIDEIFKKTKPDIVIHLAAKAGVRPSVEDPKEYSEVNINGSLNILECCVKYEVKKFINGSSSSVYGLNKIVPFKETHPLNKIASPYAATKLAVEGLCHTFNNIYKLPIINLRFFTVYGPRQRPDLAIRKFMHKMLNNEPISIYGNGETSRDYTYVDDIVNGIISSINYEKSSYEIFNLGNSSPIELLDLVNSIENSLGIKANIQFEKAQKGDVPTTYADISKSINKLHYSPQTPLKNGLDEMALWIKNNIN